MIARTYDRLARTWLANPIVWRVVLLGLALAALLVVVRAAQRSIRRHVTDADARYRARKIVSFLGYLVAAIVAISVFSEWLSGRANENWIEFTVRYVVDYRRRRWMKDHLFTRILEEVDKSENRIRLASATVEMVPGSTLDVRVSGTSSDQQGRPAPHRDTT